MKCKGPYWHPKKKVFFGCGQCIRCLINRRRTTTHRMMLEQMTHESSCVLTATFEKMPPGGTLDRRHYQNFLKRLREEIYPRKVRYFVAGEYGESGTQRPHYHIALFGYPDCAFGECPRDRACINPSCKLLNDVWRSDTEHSGGFTHVVPLNKDTAQYVCGYITKKMTNRRDSVTSDWLCGRYPEFGQPSLKPGLGAPAMVAVAEWLCTDVGAEFIIRNGDVPMSLNHGGKSWPLGRYLRRVLRELVGFKEIGAQPGWEKDIIRRQEEALLKLYAEMEIDPAKVEKGELIIIDKRGFDKELLISNSAFDNERLATRDKEYHMRRFL